MSREMFRRKGVQPENEFSPKQNSNAIILLCACLFVRCFLVGGFFRSSFSVNRLHNGHICVSANEWKVCKQEISLIC